MIDPAFAATFWPRVDRRAGVGGCWPFRTKDGRPLSPKTVAVVWVPGLRRSVQVWRVAWELTHGPVPEGATVFHKADCGNPHCCNPDHLRTGDEATRKRVQARTNTQFLRGRPRGVVEQKNRRARREKAVGEDEPE